MPTRGPLIFLDVDGVLHPLSERGFPLHADMQAILDRRDGDVVAGEFTEPCMKQLRRLVDAVQGTIVWSSTWRENERSLAAANAQVLCMTLGGREGASHAVRALGATLASLG